MTRVRVEGDYSTKIRWGQVLGAINGRKLLSHDGDDRSHDGDDRSHDGEVIEPKPEKPGN
jgi:hypothetical protein